MTRKRYIKLLMSTGIPRNWAASMAKAERADKTPYADAWQYINAYTLPYAFADIDEMHETGGDLVAEILECGMSAKPGPAVVVSGLSFVDWSGFEWPQQPNPVAGCLYAIDTTPPEANGGQWPKENSRAADTLDALRYAVEAIHNRQREVLGR